MPVDVTIEGTLASEYGRDDATIIDTQHCATKSGPQPVPCAWKSGPKQNTYRAVARVADPRGRTNATRYDIPSWTPADSQPSLSIVPDRSSYRPGQVAKLTIHSSTIPAAAVVSFARRGLISQRRLELVAESTVVELPIDISYIQNVHVSVDRWDGAGATRNGTLPMPEHVTASVELAVDLDSARLAMKTRPTRRVVQPGADATFEVEVAHDDKPVAGAEVALIVVDEAVLALSTRTYGDPLVPFYRAVEDGTTSVSTIDLVADAGDELDNTPGYERLDLDAPSPSGFGVGRGALGMRGRAGRRYRIS